MIFAGLFNETKDAMELLEEFSQLYPIEMLKVVFNGSLHDPKFDATSLLPTGVTFTDPQFFSNVASNVTSSSRVCSLVVTQDMHIVFITCSEYLRRQHS